jgi:RND family efflux transporter MFP subunit
LAALATAGRRRGEIAMRWTWSRRGLSISLFSLVGMVLFAACASVIYQRGLRGETPTPSSASAPKAEPQKTVEPASHVTLTDAKVKVADLRIESARKVSAPVQIVVAGRIEANLDRRIDIRPRAPGVVRSVTALLGQNVKAGDLLVTLDSPDVGTARLNVRNRQRELIIARTEAEWRGTIATNIEELIPALRKNTPTPVIEREFAAKPLGNDRAQLLMAYAEFQIALHEEEKQIDLFNKKIVGEHPKFLAIHSREGAQAKFEAALEQIRYDAAREKRVADQQVRLAAAATIDAAQRLRLLGVPVNVDEVTQDPEKGLTTLNSADTDDITVYPIFAPFDGTIIARTVVQSQRTELTDSLFVLADLSRVRVQANIPESDFAVLSTLQAGIVRVTAAAYPGRVFDARVTSIGSVVDQTTRMVTLVAETDNPDGLLKLGMFVRVALDSPKTESVLAIPASAVVEIEGRVGVFTPTSDGHTFKFRHVTVGREIKDQVAIAAGLAPGDRVVTTGAFKLKSELILQNEPEEE